MKIILSGFPHFLTYFSSLLKQQVLKNNQELSIIFSRHIIISSNLIGLY